MRRLSVCLALLLTVAITGDAWAKRGPPQKVAPIVQDGVKYVAPNASGRVGKVEARSEKTGEKLWDAAVYTVKIDPNLEEDVQWVFITRLSGPRRQIPGDQREERAVYARPQDQEGRACEEGLIEPLQE